VEQLPSTVVEVVEVVRIPKAPSPSPLPPLIPSPLAQVEQRLVGIHGLTLLPPFLPREGQQELTVPPLMLAALAALAALILESVQ
jgi:hypothetical protein